MKNSSLRGGFSAVFIIIIVLCVIIFGVGGYFAYKNYIEPGMNPYNAIIPESLKNYDLGKNAEGFFVYKSDKDLENLYSKIGVITEAGKVKAALGYFSNEKQSAVIIIQFSSRDIAEIATKMAKESVDSLKEEEAELFISQMMRMPEIEQKEDIMIVSLGQGLKAFEGKLAENSSISKIDKNLIDSQLIAYMNHAKSPESTLLLFAVTNTVFSGLGNYDTQLSTESPLAEISSAHAQGFINTADDAIGNTNSTSDNSTEGGAFISPTDQPHKISNVTGGSSSGGSFISTSDVPNQIANATGGAPSVASLALSFSNGIFMYSKESLIIARYKEGNLEVTLQTDIVNKSDINSSAGAFIYEKKNGTKPDINEMEKTYDEMMKTADTLIPILQDGLNEIKTSLPSSTGNISFDENALKFSFKINSSDMDKILSWIRPVQMGAPAKARNAARKADINNIVVAIETYNSFYGSYPALSACVDQMSFLNEFFPTQKSPIDPSGKQNIGSHECEGGYYYQTLPGVADGYLLWGKMERDNGNTEESPDTILTKIQDTVYMNQLPTNTTGTYYAYNQAAPIPGASTQMLIQQEAVSQESIGIQPTVQNTQQEMTTPTKKVKRVK